MIPSVLGPDMCRKATLESGNQVLYIESKPQFSFDFLGNYVKHKKNTHTDCLHDNSSKKSMHCSDACRMHRMQRNTSKSSAQSFSAFARWMIKKLNAMSHK
mmetsp:Transcript_60532/g.110366  ORF Transcript_60532/g.110366 Transcript_60532/m.110366 type:complete len:101 (-) Transcript_60532:14-316(-)